MFVFRLRRNLGIFFKIIQLGKDRSSQQKKLNNFKKNYYNFTLISCFGSEESTEALLKTNIRIRQLLINS